MIDAAALDGLMEHEVIQVKIALVTLMQSGVIDSQIQLETQRLFSGILDEDTAALAGRIIETRRRCNALLALKEVGEQFNKELNP